MRGEAESEELGSLNGRWNLSVGGQEEFPPPYILTKGSALGKLDSREDGGMTM